MSGDKRLAIRCTTEQKQYIKAQRVTRGYDNIAEMVVEILEETEETSSESDW